MDDDGYNFMAAAWLLFVLALVAMLTGCGGGTEDNPPDPTVLATDTSTAQAGDERTGAAVLVLPLLGPVLTLEQPTWIEVRLAGSVNATAHYPTHATLTVALTAPISTGPSAAPVDAAGQQAALNYVVRLLLPAGQTTLQAAAVLRSTDGSGVPAAALARALATVEWVVLEHRGVN